MGLQPFLNVVLINASQSRFFGQFNNVLDEFTLQTSLLYCILLAVASSTLQAFWNHFIPG
jgi:hypothetical protein